MAFLSYDPSINNFVWVESEEDIFFGESSAIPTPVPGTTIKDILNKSIGTGTGGAAQIAGGAQVEGSIFRAAAGFSAFGTVRDVLATPSSLVEKALTGFEGVSEFKKGMERAEVFEAARKPTATVGELLTASQQDPSIWEHGKNLFTTALSVFLGDPFGAIGGGAKTLAGFAAEFEAPKALERAGQLEQEIISKGIPAPGTIGYVNTINNFKEMQAANLAAASVEDEEGKTRLASLTPAQDIVNQAVAQGISRGTGGTDRTTLYERSSGGDIIQRTEFSGGGSFSQNISENRRTQERREQEGFTGSTSEQRRGLASDRDTGKDFSGGGVSAGIGGGRDFSGGVSAGIGGGRDF